ncbi:MAG TPA: hypothetical protein VI968_03375 [archaeon]|nr:hypothetical protein [archaeon]
MEYNADEERVLLVNFIRRAIDDRRTTPWEKEFLISMNSNVAGGRELTDKQKAILAKIKQKCKTPI